MTSRCNNKDLIVFIQPGYIDASNAENVSKIVEPGIILNPVSCKNNKELFEIKFIKESKFKTKFTIVDSDILGRISFFTDRNFLKFSVRSDLSVKSFSTFSYKLILSSNNWHSLFKKK